MATKIQHRRDTAANWTTTNPILADGEQGFETDSKPYKLKVGDGVTAWKLLPYSNPGASDPDLSAQVSANTAELARIKTLIADPTDTFTYRGNAIPAFGTTPRRAYYISLFGIRATTSITIPTTTPVTQEGTVFCFDNNSNQFTVTVLPPTGQTINGVATMPIAPNSMVFAIKKGSDWFVAFSGYIPVSLARMVDDIKAALPNSLNTITEIQAALKDRLHTFREIQAEFSDQLHTFDDIDNEMSTRGFSKGGASGGMTFDDGLTQAAGVKSVVLQNGKIGTYQDDPSKIDITTTVLFKQETGQDLKATSILTQLPLRAISNPAVTGNVVLDIVPGTYQAMEDDSYLAYNRYDIEVSPNRQAELWFDDVQKNVGSYINLDSATKSFSVEETDGLDPNLGNGEKYFVGTYIKIDGNASSDCEVDLFFWDKDLESYLVDANNNPCIISKAYKNGDVLGFLTLNVLLLAKNSRNIQLCIKHTNADPLLIHGSALDISALVVQQMKTGTLSNAFIQYEALTDHEVRIGALNLNVLADTTYEFSKDRPEETMTAGTGMTFTDGSTMFATTKVKHRTENGTFIVVNVDAAPTEFEVGWIIDPYTTRAIRGKDVNTDHIITVPLNDMQINMYKFTGTDPKKYPIHGANSGWEFVSGTDITHDASKQHDTTSFTIPADANMIAFMLVTNSQLPTFEMRLHQFKVYMDNPLVDYVVYAIESKSATRYKYDNSYANFKMLQVVPMQWTRYTINSGDTKMPVGVKKLGQAPIRNIKAWTDSGFVGEGALQFDADGLAKITTKLQMGIGEAITQGSETVTFWYAKYNSDKTFTKITESETAFTLQFGANYPKFYTMNEFKYNAKKNDALWLFAKATVDDGAFIVSNNGENAPLVETEIYFEEMTAIQNDPSINEIRFVDSHGNELFNRQLTFNVDTGKLTVTEVV